MISFSVQTDIDVWRTYSLIVRNNNVHLLVVNSEKLTQKQSSNLTFAVQANPDIKVSQESNHSLIKVNEYSSRITIDVKDTELKQTIVSNFELIKVKSDLGELKNDVLIVYTSILTTLTSETISNNEEVIISVTKNDTYTGALSTSLNFLVKQYSTSGGVTGCDGNQIQTRNQNKIGLVVPVGEYLTFFRVPSNSQSKITKLTNKPFGITFTDTEIKGRLLTNNPLTFFVEFSDNSVLQITLYPRQLSESVIV